MTSEFQAGSRVGNYVLDTYIGGGSFGAVWRGHHASSGQQVAVKLLTGALSSSETAAMRADVELLAASAASRSLHVVHVLGGGVEPIPHIVMEYIEGSDLQGMLREKGKLDSERTIDVGLAISDALGALNEAGIIHRDIKPANVMIDKEGVIKLADFGIAKIVGYETMTMTGQAAMTMAYAAPEIWDDGTSFGRPSHKSDLYAMGVLLYQCMTGDTPFRGNYGALYRAHMERRPDIDVLPEETPPSLRSLIESCLAKRQEERPPDAAACVAILQRARAELASASGAIKEPAKLGPWIKDAPHETMAWAWHCHHESRGETATVEVHFANSLDYAAELRKALSANRKLAPLGAERLIESNRLLLHPDEAWVTPPPGQFQFWIAREDKPVEPATSVTKDMLRTAVPSLVALEEAAKAESTSLAFGRNLAMLAAGGIYLRRPGLNGPQDGGDQGLLATLQALPLDAEAGAAVASVADLPSLLSALAPAPVVEPASPQPDENATRIISKPVDSPPTVVQQRAVVPEVAPQLEVSPPSRPSIPPAAASAGAMAAIVLGVRPVKSAGASGEYSLSLENLTSRSLDLHLDAFDDDDGLNYALQRHVVLPPGASEQVFLRVEPRSRRLLGGKRTTPFFVTASQGGSGEPPVTVQGQFEDQPRMPLVPVAGVFGVALAGLIAAVVLAGGGDGDNKGNSQDTGPDEPAVVAPVDTATAVPPTAVPVVVPAEPPVPAAPQVRSCDQIRATGTYVSDEERSFFISSCGAPGAPTPVRTATPVPAAPSGPAPTGPGPAAPSATPVPARVASYTVVGWGASCPNLSNCTVPTSPAGNCVGGNPNCPAPANPIPDGGTMRACNSNQLFLWVKLSYVQVPTNLAVTWYAPGGATFTGSPYRETNPDHLFWASLSRTVSEGNYRVEIRADGTLVKTATVTIAC